MSHINTPSVMVCYYDPKTEQEGQPKQIAQRCTAEVVELCKQLSMVINQLELTPEQNDTDDVVDLCCHFYYEDFLFRAYSLRERAWDVLAALAKMPRKQTGNKSFRKSVLSEIESAFPKINMGQSPIFMGMYLKKVPEKGDIQLFLLVKNQKVPFFGTGSYCEINPANKSRG